MSDFSEALTTLTTEYDKLVNQNKYLQAENEQLKSEHYKDDELNSLSMNKSRLEAKCRHYGLEQRDWDECQEWWRNHLTEKHRGSLMHDSYPTKMKMTPTYKFEVEEFAECTCYSIVCEKCGEMHNKYY